MGQIGGQLPPQRPEKPKRSVVLSFHVRDPALVVIEWVCGQRCSERRAAEAGSSECWHYGNALQHIRGVLALRNQLGGPWLGALGQEPDAHHRHQFVVPQDRPGPNWHSDLIR
jgi:hypothetical protein